MSNYSIYDIKAETIVDVFYDNSDTVARNTFHRRLQTDSRFSLSKEYLLTKIIDEYDPRFPGMLKE